MSLLPQDIRRRIPEMGSTHGTAVEKVTPQACLVDRRSGMKWYVVEFDGKNTCFGLISGRHAVMGEFTLEELETLSEVELDPDFQPARLARLARHDPALQALLPPPSEDLVELQ
ncbi:MAG TPA: hypothetical protein VLU25_16085 [Acidobacteriota bacterium]|nr:hypothetical protein [Acidobacteriota bacterium]